jgi:hypothetical protein
VDKRKLDFLFTVYLPVISITFLFATPIATPNGRTMANDSLPDLQQQWQWNRGNRLVVITLL